MKGTLLLSLILPSQQVWSFFHPEQLTRHTRHLPESTLQKLYNSVMSSPQYRSMQKHQHHQQSQVKTPLANLKHNQNRCLSILSMSMSDRDNKLSTPMTASVEPQKQQRRKKKNKYAKFSKVENDVSNENVVEDASDSSNKSKSSKEIQEQVQVLDPFEALLVESQEKNKQIEKEKAMKRNKKFGIELLDDATIVKLKNEKRQRNKILFPDNRSIDPYDPTTYGYTELGTILGPHGVHGLVKVSAVTDFSERLCRPGIRHLKAPNRRSPREIRIVEGRHRLKDEYLVKLEQIGDRNDALKLRGSVLYSRQEERPEDMKENEYMVTDLVSMEVQLVTGYGEEEEFHDDDDDDDDDDEEGEDIDSIVEDSLSGKFVGIVGGVVLGEEMCTIPGMGQDLLEIILPRGDHGTPSWKDELVLIPFVPEIVPTVDIQRKIIFINPPSGLLDFVYIKEEKTRIKGFLPEKSSWVGNE